MFNRNSFSTFIFLMLMVFMFSGCSKARNRWRANGGFFASMGGGVNADYIVVSQSGGVIMDVWKLKDVMVQSPDASDGWLFFDSKGTSIYIGGDVKIKRAPPAEVWDTYKEYHMEYESLTYREKFNPRN